MKKSVLISAFALLLSVVMFSCKPSDEKIQKQVETALSSVNGEITPKVKDGVVTLDGVVASDEAKTAAETAVKGLKDVKSVTNNIQVQIPVNPVNPDVELAKVLTTGLQNGGFADIKADVKDGVVTLTGDVKRADLQKVLEIVHGSNPQKVENKLNIK